MSADGEHAGPDSPLRQLVDEAGHRAKLPVAGEDEPHRLSLSLIDDELTGLDPVAQRHDPAHPYALLLRSGDLVPDPLARDLPLELGEGEEHV
jgi:hypothetical protein